MQPNVIFICGFGGSGKSTCGELLFEKLKSVGFIDADSVFIAKPLPMGKKLSRMKMMNTTALILNYIKGGYRNVVCIGLVWSQDELDEAIKILEPLKANHFLFWLETSKEVRFNRVLSRARDVADSLKFLENVERKIKNPWPLEHVLVHSYCINTDGLSSEEITGEVLKTLGQKF